MRRTHAPMMPHAQTESTTTATRARANVKLIAVCSGLAISGAALAQPQLQFPEQPVPPENPITEAKRVLGKVLFWDEQLSSDNTTACGTCHVPSGGGIDLVQGLHPGPDGILGTNDDIRGSLGVMRSDAFDDYAPDPLFDFAVQVTHRTAMPNFNAGFAPELFWDGRASDTFVDPETGFVSILGGGALESQAVGPVLSDVEMAHEARDWTQVAEKLETARPLVLASDLPGDVQAALDVFATYPDLFAEAFGDEEITAERIAYAIATYQRTLISDQTPFDAFIDGDTDAMTPQQQAGWNAFRGSRCATCHTPPLFTDNEFHNLGLRPNQQDTGREQVTGNPADRGAMKTPTLRNVGLRSALMHTGQFTSVDQVFPFYGGPGAPGNPNRDALLPVGTPPPVANNITAFLTEALTDPRLANETFPFDRPTLHSERAIDNPLVVGTGVAGSGGFVPTIIALVPPNLGNTGFKIGVSNALGGATAFVVKSQTPPVAGVVALDEVLGPFTMNGAGAGEGYATCHAPIPASNALAGTVSYFQWRIDDPAAPGGVALSEPVRVEYIGEVVSTCSGDFDGDGVVDLGDFGLFGSVYGASSGDDLWDPRADFNGDGDIDLGDFGAFAQDFGRSDC